MNIENGTRNSKEQLRDVTKPTKIKDPSWSLKEKLECESSITSEENPTRDKEVVTPTYAINTFFQDNSKEWTKLTNKKYNKNLF